MLKLQSSPRLARTSDNEANCGVLGVSWLNYELCVCAGNADALRLGSAPEPLGEVAALGPALRTAVIRTGFVGREVALVLAHPQLVQTYVEIPPSSAATARRLMERHVERQKPFPGAAVWHAQPAAAGVDSRSSILHMLPRELHDSLVGACRQAGLHLTVLVPASELVAGLVPDSSTIDESVLAAVEVPQAVVLVVNRAKGVPLLRRTISGSWVEDSDRIVGEIRRTVIFVRQQYQQSIGAIWLNGLRVSEEVVLGLAPVAPAVRRLQPDPVGDGWARIVRGCTAGGVNLVTHEQRVARQRRFVSRWGRVLGWMAVSSSVGLAVFAQRLREQELANRVQLDRELTRLEQSMIPLRAGLAATHQKQVVIDAREVALRPPVQVWVLGSLANALPTGLVLTNVELTSVTNGWRVRVAGWATPEGTGVPTPIIEQFSSALESGPLALRLRSQHAPPEPSKGSVVTNVGASWASRLKGEAPRPGGTPMSFDWEGILQ